MTSRILLVLTLALTPLWPFQTSLARAEQSEKEKPHDKTQDKTPEKIPEKIPDKIPDKAPDKAPDKTQEKPPSAPPHPPASNPDRPPAPPKLSTEPKPQPQPDPVKPEAQPGQDAKDKETVKKPVTSLILMVKLTLLADSRLFHHDVEVEEDQHTITLTGRVSREEEKAAAADIARSVPGVKAVVNKLAVDNGLATAIMKKQDDNITALIKERFTRSATLKAANFEVKTEEGIVSLSGTVRFQVIALEAAEAARQVPGVRAVRTEKIRLEGEG